MTCTRCGRAVAEDDRFCGGCGAALTGAGGTEDRRPVSVLFVDLVDFTPYAERADPELVRALQSEFYAAARRIVSQHGGVVEKYIGDAVMALFGAPVATENDPLRCVRAALELQRVLAASSREAARPPAGAPPGGAGGVPGGETHLFRAGIATGEALVDVAAAHDGGQAIVAGDVVNIAARIQAAAPPGGVLVCGQTRARTATEVRYQERPPVTLRGRSTPTEVWLALAPAPRAAHARLEPDPAPLVEREHELGLLAGALQRTVRDRDCQLVTIFGQPGIGKSRLVHELRRRAAELAGEPVVWLEGQCPPFGENVTYAGLADIVKAHAGILDSDDPATTADRLRRAVGELTHGPDTDRLVEALGPLVGLPGAGLPAEEAESAWRRFLVRLAASQPTVLVFEDLHWADEQMLRLISLLPAARDVPLLVLGTSRPELVTRDASWAGTITGSLTITLPPLRPRGVASLYRHLLSGDRVPTGNLPRAELEPLVELAGGNPLYAQEYVRMLVQRGDAAPDQHIADLPAPESVQAVIASRVDLLQLADRATLHAAAVVGMQFWPGAVAAALASEPARVERVLRRLERGEFVYELPESTMAGQSEFQFRHALVRDVCYQRLPRAERVARHERTADWLERLPHHRDSELVEVMAHHRWTAHEIARSLRLPALSRARAARALLHRAACRAYALHALEPAAGYVARAVSLCEPASDPEAPESERLRLSLLATEIAFYQDQQGFLADGGADRLAALADRLTAAAAPASPAGEGDPAGNVLAAAAARAWTLLGQVAWLRADRRHAVQMLDRAVALFGPLPDSPEKVDAFAELGRLHLLSYECPPAMAAARTAAAIAGRLGLADAEANASITTATARYEAGDRAGLAELRELVDRCRSERLLALPRAARNLSHLVREEGDWRRSEELRAESGRQDQPGAHNLLLEQTGDPMRAFFTGDFDAIAAAPREESAWDDSRHLQAVVGALRGDAAALADAEAALAWVGRTGFVRMSWQVHASAAFCYALAGRRDRARELLLELTRVWRGASVIASGSWVDTAAQAAAVSGEEAAEALRAPLAAQPWHTPWSEAALHTVTAATLAPAEATGGYLHAATIYAGIPAVTDQMLSLALAAGAAARAGQPERAASARAQVEEFATRNRAPVLLRLATASSAA